MSSCGTPRFVADTAEGLVLASVDLAAAPERVFAALTSSQIIDWWVRPGVFDTLEWTGDVRQGGKWRSAGIGGGQPYALGGEYLEVSPATRLVHTWIGPGGGSTVIYRLEPIEGGTRLTLRHEGLTVPAVCRNTGIGWETSCTRLEEMLAPATAAA